VTHPYEVPDDLEPDWDDLSFVEPIGPVHCPACGLPIMELNDDDGNREGICCTNCDWLQFDNQADEAIETTRPQRSYELDYQRVRKQRDAWREVALGAMVLLGHIEHLLGGNIGEDHDGHI